MLLGASYSIVPTTVDFISKIKIAKHLLKLTLGEINSWSLIDVVGT